VAHRVRRVDLHFAEYLLDRRYKILYILRKYVPDSSDPETICIAYLPGVYDKAEFAQTPVKDGEIKPCTSGITKRGNDVTLVFGRKVSIKAKFRHTFHERLTVRLTIQTLTTYRGRLCILREIGDLSSIDQGAPRPQEQSRIQVCVPLAMRNCLCPPAYDRGKG